MITVINSIGKQFYTTLQWDDGLLTSQRWRIILDEALDILASRPESASLNIHIYFDIDQIIRLTACSFGYKDRCGVDRYNGFIMENRTRTIVRNFISLPHYQIRQGVLE